MMPVYRYMDSYPHQGNQLSSGQNYHPSIEVVPPHTKLDPSKTVVINQPWPYPSSMNYSVPCYPHSTDAHFPGYYGNGFYPHSPMPQFHCCGHHPPFPSPFPAQCVPPPYYVKELPRYEYEKTRDNGYHCCGCPNHSHNQNSGGGVRIEEQEPNRGHTLVPSQLENYPHPVLLIPPEYMKNNEHKKHLESDGETQGKSLGDMKPHQNVKSHEQAPQERHSWLPLDLKSLQSLLQGDDEERTRDQKDENKMQQFPFPIFWMTPKSKQGEDKKEEQGKMDGIPTDVKDSIPSNISSPLVKLLSNGHGMDKAQEIHGNVSADSEPKEKGTTHKIIPVKPVEVVKERENSEGSERRGRTVSPKKRNDGESDKSSRRDSSSPPKSKLPPVCLRVDPLPRKKSSSMSSRSPSPPASKEKSQDKVQTCQSTLISDKETEEKNSKGVATQVAEIRKDEEKDTRKNDSTGVPVGSLVDSSDQGIQQIERNDVKSNADENEGLESYDESSTKEATEEQETDNASRCGDYAIEADKKKLSVDEAALRIQATYRGYLARKWEPLRKLKQIAEVREQMIELGSKIHDLESSLDVRKDEKQTAVIGEMIMRLLLKLDTIQGLNPSFRDVRKSLAKELVMLQERLDSLPKATCTEKHPDIQEDKSGDPKEHSIDDIPQSADAISKSQDTEASKPLNYVEDKQIEARTDVHIVDSGLESPSNELKKEVDGELDSSTEVEHNQGVISKELIASAEEPNEKVILEDCSPAKNDDSGDVAQVLEMLNELPVEVIENEEPLQHKQSGLPEKDAPMLDGDMKEKAVVDVPEGLTTKDAMLESSEVAEVSNKNEPEFTPAVGSMDPVDVEKAGNNLTGENMGISCIEEEKGGDNQDSVCQPSEEHASEGETLEQEQETVNTLEMSESCKDEVSSVITDKQSEISREESKKLVEENEKMREMVQKLLESGKEQLAVISNLTGRLNELEHKLRHTKRKARRHRTAIPRKPSARKQSVNAAA